MGWPLLDFSVERMFALGWTEFLKFQSLRAFALILRRRVISVLTLRARHRDDFSGHGR